MVWCVTSCFENTVCVCERVGSSGKGIAGAMCVCACVCVCAVKLLCQRVNKMDGIM